MQLQFSLRRFLLAAAALAAVLAFFEALGVLAVMPWLAIPCAVCAFALVLVAKRSDLSRITWAGVFSMIGGLVAAPPLSEPGSGVIRALWHEVLGAAIGGMIGSALARLDEHFRSARDAAANPIKRPEEDK